MWQLSMFATCDVTCHEHNLLDLLHLLLLLCLFLLLLRRAGNEEMVCVCTQVLALTAAADGGNAQELVLTNGLAVVVDVLHRSLALLQPTTPRDNVHLKICASAFQVAAAAADQQVNSFFVHVCARSSACARACALVHLRVRV